MKCPSCGHESSEGAEFCGKCGKPLRQEGTCSKCGHKNPFGNSFCEKCGQPLTEQSAPAPTNYPPQPLLLFPPPSPTAVTRSRSSSEKAARRRSIWPMIPCWTGMSPLLSSRQKSWTKQPGPASSGKPRRWASWATTPISSPSTIWVTTRASLTWSYRLCPAEMWKDLSRKLPTTSCPWINQ